MPRPADRRRARCGSPATVDCSRRPGTGAACASSTCRGSRHGSSRREGRRTMPSRSPTTPRSEEHTSELQSLRHLVCRLLLEKKKKQKNKQQQNKKKKYAR